MATAAVLEVRSGPTGRGAGLAVREDARRRTERRERGGMVTVTRQLATEKCALTHSNAVAVQLSNYQKRTRVIISDLSSKLSNSFSSWNLLLVRS